MNKFEFTDCTGSAYLNLWQHPISHVPKWLCREFYQASISSSNLTHVIQLVAAETACVIMLQFLN
jgi:hypothetical protein